MALGTDKQLYIAVGVLAVVGLAYYFQSQKVQQEQKRNAPVAQAELPKIKIAGDDKKKVDKIVIERPAPDDKEKDKDAKDAKDDAAKKDAPKKPPEKVELIKKGEEWRVASAKDALANKSNVDSLVNNLETLEISETVDSTDQKYEDFKVTDAKATHVQIYQGNEVALDLFVGERGGRGSMVRLKDKKGVFAIKGFSDYLYSRPLKDWRDRTIFNFDDAKVASVELSNDVGLFNFTREKAEEAKKDDAKKPDAKKDESKKDDAKKDDAKKDDAKKPDEKKDEAKKDEPKIVWKALFKDLKDPKAKSVALEDFDEAKLKDLLRAYKALNADDFGDSKSDSDVGLDKPTAVLTIVLEDGARRVVKVGANSEGQSRWAKTEDSPQIYSVSSWSADWTTAKADKFQTKKDKKDEKKDDKAAKK